MPLTSLIGILSGLTLASVPVLAASDALSSRHIVAQAETAPTLETPQEVPVEFDRDAILAKASAALNGVETAKGRFVQQSSDGYVSTGNFALRRPGRLRFSYDAPDPILIVSDGTTLAIEDRALETVDRVPLAATPLNLILKRDTDFAEDADVLGVRDVSGYAVVQLADKTGEAEGVLTLYFDLDTYDLRQWDIEDPQSGHTTVQLLDVSTGERLDPKLFRLEDPEDEEDDRRR